MRTGIILKWGGVGGTSWEVTQLSWASLIFCFVGLLLDCQNCRATESGYDARPNEPYSLKVCAGMRKRRWRITRTRRQSRKSAAGTVLTRASFAATEFSHITPRSLSGLGANQSVSWLPDRVNVASTFCPTMLKVHSMTKINTFTDYAPWCMYDIQSLQPTSLRYTGKTVCQKAV